MQKAVEHGADGSRVAQQFAPVFHWTVRSQHRAGAFIAAHDDLQQFLGGGERQLAHAEIGISAAFTQVSDTEITAKVPKDATTGPIKVVVPSGTLSSNVTFQVIN